MFLALSMFFLSKKYVLSHTHRHTDELLRCESWTAHQWSLAECYYLTWIFKVTLTYILVAVHDVSPGFIARDILFWEKCKSALLFDTITVKFMSILLITSML